MGSDVGGEWASGIVVGTNITISITADTREQADHSFNSLSQGGISKYSIETYVRETS